MGGEDFCMHETNQKVYGVLILCQAADQVSTSAHSMPWRCGLKNDSEQLLA
jgi:hypothetical protein